MPGRSLLRLTGVGMALLAAALFGASTPLAKGLLQDTSPQLLAGLLYLGSGVGLLVVWLGRRGGTRSQAALSRRDMPWLAGAIGSGGVLGPVLLMYGLIHAPASSASLLLNLEGVFTTLITGVVFREHVPFRIAVGMIAIVAGGAMLSWEGQVAWGSVWGPLAVAGACLCWAIDNNLTQRVSAGDPVQIAQIKGLMAGGVNTGLALSLGARLPGPFPVAGALLVGFLGYGVSLVCFVLALRGLGAARTGAYFSLSPFIGAALGILLYRETVTPLFLLAAALMGVGLWLHLSEHHEHSHGHEPAEHEHSHVHDEHHQHTHGLDDPPGQPHSHPHQHRKLAHSHPHYPDIHHRHVHL